MEEEGDAPQILVTAQGAARTHARNLGLQTLPLPAQRSRAAMRAAIFDEARPDLLLWMGRDLSDPLLAEAQRRAIPSILIDAGHSGPLPEAGWWPGRTKARLRGFTQVFADNAAIARRLTRAGIAKEAIRITGPLRDIAPPAPIDPAEQAARAALFRARPVWLAAHAQAAELPALIAAQRRACRHAHRLTLILHLADPRSAPMASAQLAEARMPHADWDAGEEADDTHQVLLSTDPAELPYWLHLAPSTFLGGSLQGAPRLNPLRAAQLGSVVIHGPNRGPFGQALLQLEQSGASCPIASEAELSSTLERLLAPDFTAQKAGAGWHAVTEGALATNHLTDTIRALRSKEPADARA